MLTEQLEKLKNLLPESYKPFPFIDDRKFWENVPKHIKDSYINEASQYTEKIFPVLNASLFMEFHQNGNRSNYQSPYSERRITLNTAVLSELFENKGRFINLMVDLIWMMCEETTWIIPAHNIVGGYKHNRLPLPDFDRPIIDLMSADTGASIALALYFFKDKFDSIAPQISKRAEYEIDRRLITEYRNHTDYWWMGFMGDSKEQLNNWNPWINSNMLIVLLLSNQTPAEKFYILSKITQSLDAYIDGHPNDGGCDEGPGYWGRAGASLFECLEMLYEYTDGLINIFEIPKIKNICQFIHRAHISGNFYVNFADAAPKANTDPALIYRFGKMVNNPSSMAFGALQHKNIEMQTQVLGRFGINRPIREFSVLAEMCDYHEPYRSEKNVFLEDIQVVYLRVSSTSGELFLAAKGGNNMENHNHNDVGNFVIYYNGKPFIIDVGNMVYTKKTFSPQRYEIWSNCSLWHNVPEINGQKQLCGHDYKASDVVFSESESTSVLTMNLKKAYPSDSGIVKWIRTFTMNQISENIIIEDSFELEKESDQLIIRLMTHSEPVISSESIILNSEGKSLIITHSDNVTPYYERIDLDDTSHQKSWGENLYRLSLKLNKPLKSGKIKLNFKLI